MWVDRIVGTPHTWGLAAYPVAHGRICALYEPPARADAGSYPVERDFPEVDGAPEEVAALWLGNAFEIQALVLGVAANLPGVPWPPVGSSYAQLMHVRGIGRIWICSRAQAEAAVEDWARRARDKLCSGEALDPSDERMIRKLLREIEKEKAVGMPDQKDDTQEKPQTDQSAAANEASTAMDTDDMHDPVLPGVPPGQF